MPVGLKNTPVSLGPVSPGISVHEVAPAPLVRGTLRCLSGGAHLCAPVRTQGTRVGGLPVAARSQDFLSKDGRVFQHTVQGGGTDWTSTP